MADLQEIIKTHTKSYPSYLDTYPRNGKTTEILNCGGLKKKYILRLAKAKLKKEKKMTLPILHTPLCCSASNQHKAQLTTTKKDGGRVLKKGMHFLFLK